MGFVSDKCGVGLTYPAPLLFVSAENVPEGRKFPPSEGNAAESSPKNKMRGRKHMKKKTLSLALALVMCLGLTVPAFAEEDPDAPMSVEEGLKNVVLEVEIGDLEPEDIQVKKSLTLREIGRAHV